MYLWPINASAILFAWFVVWNNNTVSSLKLLPSNCGQWLPLVHSQRKSAKKVDLLEALGQKTTLYFLSTPKISTFVP